MIVYDNRDLTILFHSTGSALLNSRSFIPGFVSFLIAFLADDIVEVANFLDLRLESPTVYFNGVAFLVSFVVVFRSQLAYQRFFGALNSYFRMKARILDLLSQTRSFCLSNELPTLIMKENVARWIRLYHKLALTRLRGGYIKNIYLKNLVTEEELDILLSTRERNEVVMYWITRSLTENINSFTAPAPIVGRLFQLASDADIELNGALMVAETPFPFPYAQLTSFLLVIWMITTPLFVSRWVNIDPALSALLAFLSTWIIFAVNESAVNLESPTDGDSNDIPLLYYDIIFDSAADTAQLLVEPKQTFKVSSKCFVGDTARRRTTSRRGLLVPTLSVANHPNGLEPNSSGVWNSLSSFLSRVRSKKRSDDDSDSDKDSVVYIDSARSGRAEEDFRDLEAETIDPRDVVLNPPLDPRFVDEETALSLFNPFPDIQPYTPIIERMFNWLYHTPPLRSICSSRVAEAQLREALATNVDASTMRAQGKFTKYT